ncbi:MAG: hypothetical protein WCP46_08580, partial [Alphaproteobacteria bacterium]
TIMIDKSITESSKAPAAAISAEAIRGRGESAVPTPSSSYVSDYEKAKLKDLQSKIDKMNPTEINDEFVSAAGSGQQEIVKWMLSLGGSLRLDKKGAFNSSMASKHGEIARMIGKSMMEPSKALPAAIAADAVRKRPLEFSSKASVAPAILADLSRIHSLAAVSASPTPSSTYVMGDEEKAKLKSLQSKSRMDQATINWELLYAAHYDQKGIMEWMLSPGSSLKPDQDGFNTAFAKLAKEGEHGTMEWMLSLGSSLKLDQNGINTAFSDAAHYGKKETMEMMLRLGLKPDQYGFNQAFIQASRAGKQEIMEWMLSLNKPLGPDQAGVNQAFNSVVQVVIPMILAPRENAIHDNSMYGHATVDEALGIMEWMLSQDRPLRPDQDAITKSHQSAVQWKCIPITNLLQPYMPVAAK